MESGDGNVATNVIDEVLQVLLRESFETQAKYIIENHEDNKMKSLKRSIIIQELDGEVNNNTDERLMSYVLNPQSLIIERFEQKWLMLKTATDGKLNSIVQLVSKRLTEIFELIEKVNTVLQDQGGHSLAFVDELFESRSDQDRCLPLDKKFCMATLFYDYLIGEQMPTEITIRTGSIYRINDRWKNLVEQFTKPNEEIMQIFRLAESAFKTATISYLGLFLEEILSQQAQKTQETTDQMNSFISKTYSSIHDYLLKQIQGCEAQCPCCKRVCDVDHHLDASSPIGQKENRHRCQFGHQIRGMGGIRYEFTNEASMAWCEILKDNDPVTTSNNDRQSWKTFKDAHADWDFGDSMIRENLETHYFSIWKRIGGKLCDHFGNGMKYVEKNSPPPINHFILILDHSGSMNQINRASMQYTPWENLIQAVKAFLDIRIRQFSRDDQITTILFGNRAERIYKLEKLTNVDIERLKIPIGICVGGTFYSAAFQMAIKTLEEANNHPERKRLRHTIIFMTDGEPLDDSTAELQKLCDWREGS